MSEQNPDRKNFTRVIAAAATASLLIGSYLGYKASAEGTPKTEPTTVSHEQAIKTFDDTWSKLVRRIQDPSTNGQNTTMIDGQAISTEGTKLINLVLTSSASSEVGDVTWDYVATVNTPDGQTHWEPTENSSLTIQATRSTQPDSPAYNFSLEKKGNDWEATATYQLSESEQPIINTYTTNDGGSGEVNIDAMLDLVNQGDKVLDAAERGNLPTFN